MSLSPYPTPGAAAPDDATVALTALEAEGLATITYHGDPNDPDTLIEVTLTPKGETLLAISNHRMASCHPDRRHKAGGLCAPCYNRGYSRKEYQRTYRATPEGKAKRAARKAIHDAVVRDGVVVREPCRTCGSSKVEAHHYAGYGVLQRLLVRWYCRPCHNAVHRLAAS